MRLEVVVLVVALLSLQHSSIFGPLFQGVAGATLGGQLLKIYLSNEQLAAWMDEYVHRCGSISRKFSIGKSVLGTELWVLELSDKPGQPEPEPNFKYISNMHGNEPSGRVLLPQLAEWLCAHNGKDERASRIINHMHLYLLPSLNPDGFARMIRANAAGVDLNRNFPDPVELKSVEAMLQPLPRAAPETRAFMAWSLATQFSGAASLHEGAVLANYPFDGYSDHSMRVNGSRHPAPDDATFLFLAKLYAAKHQFMAQNKFFPQGVTNGAAWYPVYGGMQDWDYLAAGCLDLTLELSDNKWRPESDLQQLWEENRDALLALPIAAALGGVSGRVTSTADGSPLAAVIMVQGIARNSSARVPFGFYQRPLAPGSYNLTAVLDGYLPATSAVTVPADGSGITRHFQLTPAVVAGAPAAPRRDATISSKPAESSSSSHSGSGNSGNASSSSSSGSGSSSSSTGSGSSSSSSPEAATKDDDEAVGSGMGHLSVRTHLKTFVGHAAIVRREADGLFLAVLGLALCVMGSLSVCWMAGISVPLGTQR